MTLSLKNIFAGLLAVGLIGCDNKEAPNDNQIIANMQIISKANDTITGEITKIVPHGVHHKVTFLNGKSRVIESGIKEIDTLSTRIFKSDVPEVN